jgi:hypothetical protein
MQGSKYGKVVYIQPQAAEFGDDQGIRLAEHCQQFVNAPLLAGLA